MAKEKPELLTWEISIAVFLICAGVQTGASQSQSAYFLPEFALSPQGSFLEDTTGEQFLTFRYDDQTSRITRSDEDKDLGWDAWGSWSDCSRTCGGAASYSLRRCLNGRNCEGRNIRYKTCSNMECPVEIGDFRAQQCSAHNDVKYQGHTYEWLPVYNDPAAPCALKCKARGTNQVVELAPKVLDGTRCKTDSLDMCISGICQAVGCDRQLGSNAKEDNCGVCAGDGSTCRLVRGQSKTHVSPEKPEETVIAVPYGSRNVRITAKGPDHLIIDSKTLQGQTGEHSFNSPGSFLIENTTVEFQKDPDRQSFRIQGPLGADFNIKVRYVASRDTVVHFIFYHPISHQWRETDFFPCTVTCGGGYQLNSAECMDVRLNRVVSDQYCHYYPENKKPKPKLKECSMDPCPASDGFKEIMPYDHFQPLPRWEHNPWTACSVSCGGGIQTRSIVCVEETMHGEILQVEEWKCMYTPKPTLMQTCNLFDCPKWIAMEWSQCTVTCGRGLRYRVVLCIDHHGQHIGGCNPQLKPHIKEECVVPIACYKPKEKLPVEAKLPWFKQAQELEEPRAASEEPTYIPKAWSPCSVTCGPGRQTRQVTCRVLLSFSQTEAELPDDECEDSKPPTERGCNLGPCDGDPAVYQPSIPLYDDEELCDWEYEGFTSCSASCAGGKQEAVVVCLNKQERKAVGDALCDGSSRPPEMIRICNPEPCPARWEVTSWSQCSASCGVGIKTRNVYCTRVLSLQPEDSATVAEQECQETKPAMLQACNQFDCPPTWIAEDWQECSHSCAGGTQSRKVHCKQLLSDGSFLKLPDDFCHDPRPLSHTHCAKTDCPPEVAGGDWSKCSVSCGVGTQRREAVCRRLTATGQQVTLSRSVCSDLPSPPLIRTCRMNACPNHKKEMKPKQSQNHNPQILSLNRVYIQTRQEKRIHFTIGGRAYLLPKTSVVIKCPVRRFQKMLIRWEKDGQDLSNSKRIGVTTSGSLKIHSLEASDIGMYRCVAGSATETFNLKLIGNDNRLIEPPNNRKLKMEMDLNEANRLEEKWNRMSKMWQSWSEKNEFYLDDSQAHDQALLHVLGNYLTNSAEPSGFQERPDKHLEAAILHGAYSMDSQQFEELVRNISQLVENREVTDDMASQLIYQLMAEASSPQSTTEKWKGSLQENTSNSKLVDKTPNTSEHVYNKQMYKKPSIIRHKLNPLMAFQKSNNVSIGRAAFLTNATRTVILLCEATGVPEPKLTWTKNGMQLQFSKRVAWDSTGRLQISSPAAEDAGLYGCTVTNDLGSDTETSLLLFAEAPSIRGSWKNVSDLVSRRVTAVVGGSVTVSSGANVTLECPVTGVPQPTISWHKNKGLMKGNNFLLLNGSLLLQNISIENYGMYSCIAANPFGKAVASSFLQLSALRTSVDQSTPSRGNGRKRVLMASQIGTNIAVKSGDLLRIGCPVLPNHRNAVRWYLRNQTLPEVRGLEYRVLVGGRVLEVSTLSGRFDGQYRCQTTTNSQILSAWINVMFEAYRWELSDWTACSSTCGHKGTQSRRLVCIGASGQEVTRSACDLLPRRASPTQPCNIQDCPPRWVSSKWSKCSASCGKGIRQRQTSCQQVTANGIARILPVNACVKAEQPSGREDCVSDTCAEWRELPWGKCSGRCLAPSLSVQQRQVVCQNHNGSSIPESHCDERKRPVSVRNCSSEMCDVQWGAGAWRACTAACGSGFQSRRVECVHRRNNKTVADRYCSWQKQPMTWQHCNATSCSRGECKDTTHYCAVVKRLQLCLIDLYKQRCCESCQEV
ncbi:ADAMTS-like protein 3 isoform X2 [Polyodon spathula]|uniref:ADAMTS-like protein 3 isoform X2 n=1 Tax=Polyodon spathula TaxID=7913 RepID=UPI001B7E501C|nr:ADAMTS-like protein 3 isoform X2 [Polyodon spathula]